MTALMLRLLALITFLLVACSQKQEALLQLEQSGATMGTTFSVTIALPPDQVASFTLEDEVEQALSRIEKTMSTYLPDSDLSLFNSSVSTEWQPVAIELCVAIERSLRLAELTGGNFDITLGPLVNLWGFGPAGVVYEPPAAKDVEHALEKTGYRKLEADCANSMLRKTDESLYVDLSAFAKGFAVDKLAELLDHQEIHNYLVEIGGEVRARGRNGSGDNWRIAIEKPADNDRTVQAIVNITDMAIATSGDYRNFFEYENKRYSHTIDPHTGRPVEHRLASVSVVAQQAARADALATALFVMGPAEGPKFAEQNAISALFLILEEPALEKPGINEIFTGDFAGLISR